MITLCREVCICHACYKQASTNVNNHTFQSRWKPKQALPKAICSVDTCDETVYRNTNMASREQIENSVGQKLVTFAIIVLLPLVLHSVSPMYVHNSLHARQLCASCGSKLKRGEKDHFRDCSSPEVINCYLTTISGEISILTACSKICMSL